MKRNAKILLAIVLSICLIISQTSTVFAASTSVKTVKAKYAQNVEKTIEVVWSKAKSVNGYEIYRSDMGGKYSKIGTVNKQSTTKYVDKKAKLGHVYKYKVRAFKKVDGKKKYGKYSNIVSGMVEGEKLYNTKITLKCGDRELSSGSMLSDMTFDESWEVYVDGEKVTDFKACALDNSVLKVKKVDGKLQFTVVKEGKCVISIVTGDGKAGLFVAYPGMFSVATRCSGSKNVKIQEDLENGNTYQSGSSIQIPGENRIFNVLYKGKKVEDFAYEVLNYDWMGDETLKTIDIGYYYGQLSITPNPEDQHYIKVTVKGGSSYFIINS